MIFKAGIRVLFISVLILSVYWISYLQLGNAQTENWKRFDDPGRKFTFLYPPTWTINSTRHDNINGFTEVILTNPNSTRMKVSVLYTPKDSLLESDTGKTVLPSKALATSRSKLASITFSSTVLANFHTNIPFKSIHLQVI